MAWLAYVQADTEIAKTKLWSNQTQTYTKTQQRTRMHFIGANYKMTELLTLHLALLFLLAPEQSIGRGRNIRNIKCRQLGQTQPQPLLL